MAELGTAARGDEGVDGSGGGDEETRETDGRRGKDGEEHSPASFFFWLVVIWLFSGVLCRTRENVVIKTSVGYSSQQQQRQRTRAATARVGAGVAGVGENNGRCQVVVPPGSLCTRQLPTVNDRPPATCQAQPSSFDPASLLIMLGKLVHLTADALIISAFLAGIRRSTSLTLVTSRA